MFGPSRIMVWFEGDFQSPRTRKTKGNLLPVKWFGEALVQPRS